MNIAHTSRLRSPIRLRVLDNAERVDPKISMVESSRNQNSITKEQREISYRE